MKSPEEMAQELLIAKSQAIKDSNRRKLIYAEAENSILREEKKLESMKLFISIVAKYSISMDDMVTIMETVPYV